MSVDSSQTQEASLPDKRSTSHVNDVLLQLDNSKLTHFHWKAMITSGMGFFTDAYDLFIIGAVLSILIPLWKLNALEISLVGSTSLIAAAFGSYVFGILADRIGRHSIYGLTLIVLAAGAIVTALSPNIYWLLFFRFVMGLGIGGDYPLSATLMSEYANRKDRGKLITMVFSMQGLGLIFGPLVAILLLVSGLQQDLIWRAMLALGAVPALATFYLRRQIAETPRFALIMHGNVEEAKQTINGVTSSKTSAKKSRIKAQSKQGIQKSWLHLLFTRRYLGWIIGTAGTWFLLDIAYYGTTISNPLVLKALNPQSDTITNMIYTLLIFVVAALPGYILTALTIDKLGRKTIQCIGFGVMALAYGLMAVIPDLTHMTVPFLIVFAVSYFFTEFGPNSTTFVYPAEIFPVMIRSSAHGIAAALGKVGAFIGAFTFPYILTTFNLPGVTTVSAIISLLGLLLTLYLLPEPNQRTLEEISGDHELLAERQKEAVANEL
jgi:PHS family inorganic phosphate transporter-like MFS transporter